VGRNPFGIFSQISGALKPTVIFWSHKKSHINGEKILQNRDKKSAYFTFEHGVSGLDIAQLWSKVCYLTKPVGPVDKRKKGRN
jgi:hypothetical protein